MLAIEHNTAGYIREIVLGHHFSGIDIHFVWSQSWGSSLRPLPTFTLHPNDKRLDRAGLYSRLRLRASVRRHRFDLTHSSWWMTTHTQVLKRGRIMNYIPISTDSKGAIDVPDRPGMKVTLADADTAGFTPAGMTLKVAAVSASIMTDIGLGGLLWSGSGNATYFVLDYVATQNLAVASSSLENVYQVMGVGLRLGFRGIGLSTQMSASLGALAATATLNNTASSLQAYLVGTQLNMGSLPLVQSLINLGLSTFNVDTLRQVGGVFTQLADYLTQNGASATPVPIGLILNENAQFESVATSYGYALRCIGKGYSWQKATAQKTNSLPAGVQRLDAVLAATYASVLGSTDQTASPTKTQIQYANQLYNCGP